MMKQFIMIVSHAISHDIISTMIALYALSVMKDFGPMKQYKCVTVYLGIVFFCHKLNQFITVLTK